MQATMNFKLLGGQHVDANGKLYKRGDVVPAHSDLAGTFPGKFERLGVVSLSGSAQPSKLMATAIAKENQPVSEPVVAELEKPKKDFGEDVTKLFPAAQEAALLVFRKGRDYSVVDPDEAGLAMNDKPLKRGGVKGFIAQFIEKG